MVLLLLGAGLGGFVGMAQTPILTFSDGEDRWGYFGHHVDDITSAPTLAPGSSGVRWHSKFGADISRNPSVSYPNVSWSSPPFFGGYLLYTTNDSNGDYFPNFVRTVSSPATGRGYASLPITEFVTSGSTGTLTNSIFGTFVTPTPISGDGEFRIYIHENTSDHVGVTGATAMFRGAAFDGTRWLVTADSSVVSTEGTDHALVSTRGGWVELDTEDFSYGTESATPAGPLSMSGVWFLASESTSPGLVGFHFGFSDAYFTARPAPEIHTADSDEDLSLSLEELLRVIELYNTRSGSSRTGRYGLSETSSDRFEPVPEQSPTSMALYERYHSGDIDRDGSIALSELLRVIELYNTRGALSRSGRYQIDTSTPDGFAPNPSV